ncbi:hypothetical protein AV530_019032 [Patagioenas fasciata monilis]|uniref:Uncharacterized protein n=1 Tax=Patagioenas fasciata monilis TaxID=372326 RepID=A0A1V4KWZ2_PATFA|nr:hypothetical protein AV530_019032 [Patagioenas fasciata monilis]
MEHLPAASPAASPASVQHLRISCITPASPTASPHLLHHPAISHHTPASPASLLAPAALGHLAVHTKLAVSSRTLSR